MHRGTSARFQCEECAYNFGTAEKSWNTAFPTSVLWAVLCPCGGRCPRCGPCLPLGIVRGLSWCEPHLGVMAHGPL